MCVFSLFLQAKQAQEGQEQQEQDKLAHLDPLKAPEGSRRPKKAQGDQEEQGGDRNQVEKQQEGPESGESGHPPSRGHQVQQEGKVPHFLKGTARTSTLKLTRATNLGSSAQPDQHKNTPQTKISLFLQ